MLFFISLILISLLYIDSISPSLQFVFGSHVWNVSSDAGVGLSVFILYVFGVFVSSVGVGVVQPAKPIERVIALLVRNALLVGICYILSWGHIIFVYGKRPSERFLYMEL